jgi:hypothetical protein
MNWLPLIPLLLSITLQPIVPQTALYAWSDPNDGREAMYAIAPAHACAVSLSDGVITISFCEDS